MYDLTVADIHSYYVVAGSTPVLVHNASCVELTDLGAGWYETPAQLLYGPGSKHGHRIFHVLAHGYPDPTKTNHTVFFLQSGETILGLVDEAWLRRASTDLVAQQGPKAWWLIPMDRKVGTAGEGHICVIVNNLDEIVTAYPTDDPGKCGPQ
jgi:hypothetical protein